MIALIIGVVIAIIIATLLIAVCRELFSVVLVVGLIAFIASKITGGPEGLQAIIGFIGAYPLQFFAGFFVVVGFMIIVLPLYRQRREVRKCSAALRMLAKRTARETADLHVSLKWTDAHID